mmetsp:Transcript_107144/g.245292  ORF Transcript_107144/g.245292 Transcript_107144/m.245292 type:complete len:1136 (+) Transcript_107144:20-3427(+)
MGPPVFALRPGEEVAHEIVGDLQFGDVVQWSVVESNDKTVDLSALIRSPDKVMGTRELEPPVRVASGSWTFKVTDEFKPKQLPLALIVVMSNKFAWMADKQVEMAITVSREARVSKPTVSLLQLLQGSWITRQHGKVCAVTVHGDQFSTVVDGAVQGPYQMVERGNSVIGNPGNKDLESVIDNVSPDCVVWKTPSGIVEWMRKEESSEQRFLVDNTVLRASTPGLGYRKSMSLDDKDGNHASPWGWHVTGELVGDQWLLTSKGLYLPVFLSGCRVLKLVGDDILVVKNGAEQLGTTSVGCPFDDTPSSSASPRTNQLIVRVEEPRTQLAHGGAELASITQQVPSAGLLPPPPAVGAGLTPALPARQCSDNDVEPDTDAPLAAERSDSCARDSTSSSDSKPDPFGETTPSPPPHGSPEPPGSPPPTLPLVALNGHGVRFRMQFAQAPPGAAFAPSYVAAAPRNTAFLIPGHDQLCVGDDQQSLNGAVGQLLLEHGGQPIAFDTDEMGRVLWRDHSDGTKTRSFHPDACVYKRLQAKLLARARLHPGEALEASTDELEGTPVECAFARVYPESSSPLGCAFVHAFREEFRPFGATGNNVALAYVVADSSSRGEPSRIGAEEIVEAVFRSGENVVVTAGIYNRSRTSVPIQVLRVPIISTASHQGMTQMEVALALLWGIQRGLQQIPEQYRPEIELMPGRSMEEAYDFYATGARPADWRTRGSAPNLFRLLPQDSGDVFADESVQPTVSAGSEPSASEPGSPLSCPSRSWAFEDPESPGPGSSAPPPTPDAGSPRPASPAPPQKFSPRSRVEAAIEETASGIDVSVYAQQSGQKVAETTTWEVILRKQDHEERLGLVLGPEIGPCRKILEVKPGGAVSRFNEESPERAVRSGDVLVAVNSKRTADAVHQEMASFAYMRAETECRLQIARDVEIARVAEEDVSTVFPGSVWIAQLSKEKDGEKLGMLVAESSTGFGFTVHSIQAIGSVSRWNSAHPKHIIRAGDEVLSVNGKTGPDDGMEEMKAFAQGRQCKLVMRRGLGAVIQQKKWAVTVAKENHQDRLGLTLDNDFTDDGKYQVRKVRDGMLVAQWNKANPEAAVWGGDVVESVNGMIAVHSIEQEMTCFRDMRAGTQCILEISRP